MLKNVSNVSVLRINQRFLPGMHLLSIYWAGERFSVVGIEVCKKSKLQLMENFFSNSNYLQKETFKSGIVQIKLCKENHGLQLPPNILKISMFSCKLFCNSCSFSLFYFCFKFSFPNPDIIVNYLYMFFSVRIKPIQNVIIKNEKNPWLEILLHLKKYRFPIFVWLDLLVLENCALM